MNFEEIMAFNAPYNQMNFDSLIKEIKLNNNIIPYVGAGTSMLFENIYPSWGGFLETTFEKYCLKEKKTEFYKLSYEEKADYLYEKLGPISFNDHLKHTFGEKYLNGTSACFYEKAIYLLPLIFNNNLILTTNYDKVIEKMYQLNNILLTTLHPGHKEALNNSLRTNKLLLYKIHGDISEPTSIILTKDQYDKVYQDDRFKSELKKIFVGKQMFFLGCSLQKDRPLDLMKEILENGMVNYAIISCDDSHYEMRRKELEKQYNIKAIIYPDGRHECLRILLEKIVEHVNPEGFSSIHIKKTQTHNINRFKYDSETCSFFGRELEINQIVKFCNDSNTFLWWSICGSGGGGKSRIAWELEKKIKSKQIKEMQNWNVIGYIPKIPITMDTLVIIDDSLNKFKDISQFMEQRNHMSSTYKCRLLLIERDFQKLYQTIEDEMYTPFLIDQTLYNNVPLVLGILEQGQLKNIARSYAKNNNFTLSEDQLVKITTTLLNIDKKLARPLYLLFITDAVLNGDDVTKWNRTEALDYVYKKEVILLKRRIRIIISKENPCFEKAFNALFLLINFSDSCSISFVETFFKKYINILNKYLDPIGYTLKDFLNKIGFLTGNKILRIEPHIIGEYFVLKLMKELNNETNIDVLSTIWSTIDLSWKFVENLYLDFQDILISESLINYFEHIQISSECTKIYITAFWAHKHLKSVFIPRELTYINPDSFNFCSNLTTINVDKENQYYTSVNGILFSKDMSDLIVYPYGKQDFEYKVQNNVKNIKISNNDTLKKIILPDSATTLSIVECSELEEIVLNVGLQEIKKAFNGCAKLSEIFIPKSVGKIEQCPFNRCNKLKRIEVNPNNENYFSHEGVLYNKKDKSLLVYPLGKMEQIYSIMIGTLSIAHNAFCQNKYICKIVIPNGVQTIGGMAFAGCYSLQIVSMADTVKYIDRFAFSLCCNLRYINLSKTLQKIEDQMFVDCKSLESIYIPNNIKKIGYKAFAGCDFLKKIEISNGVEFIDGGCFESCECLEKISLPVNLKKINSRTFAGCTSLKDIIIPNSISEIDRDVFIDSQPKRHIRKDNSYFAEQVGQLFSFFRDDLYSIYYILANDNSIIDTRNEIKGTKILKLDITYKNNLYDVNYWYKNKECTQKWNYDVDTIPEQDLCLYARLVKK